MREEVMSVEKKADEGRKYSDNEQEELFYYLKDYCANHSKRRVYYCLLRSLTQGRGKYYARQL